MHAQHDRKSARRLLAIHPRDPARGRVIAWVGIAGFVIMILVLAQTPLGKATLDAVGITAAARPYTELSFGPAFPPATQTAGTTVPVPIEFVIGNGSDTARSGSWRVEQDDAPRATAITRRADLGPRERRQQETTIFVTCTAPSVRITVTTDLAAVSISHTITCTPPPGGPVRRSTGGSG